MLGDLRRCEHWSTLASSTFYLSRCISAWAQYYSDEPLRIPWTKRYPIHIPGNAKWRVSDPLCACPMPPRSRHRSCVFGTLSVQWEESAGQLVTLPLSEHREIDPRIRHDSFSAPLWVISVSLCQSIKINATNIYITRAKAQFKIKIQVLKLKPVHFRRVVSCSVPHRPCYWSCGFFVQSLWLGSNVLDNWQLAMLPRVWSSWDRFQHWAWQLLSCFSAFPCARIPKPVAGDDVKDSKVVSLHLAI